MSITEIIAALAAAAAVLSTFLEVSKIKINPWSAIFRWIGNKMMADVKQELQEVKEEQEQLKKQRAADAMDAIKAEIFRFYNECQKKERHSEAEFNYIIQQNKKYESLVKETEEPNGVYEMEYLYILDIYRKCQKEKDFSLRGEQGEGIGKGKMEAQEKDGPLGAEGRAAAHES